MKIQCHIVHPDHPKVPHGLRKILETALSIEGNHQDKITIILCTDSMIRRLNREYLHDNSTTDVLSFYYSNPKSKNLYGEVYINLDITRKQAIRYNVSFWNELLRLIFHGILHLYGYDDSTKIEYKRMADRQEELITKCQGLLHW
jgi:probable rRNA maturation factor